MNRRLPYKYQLRTVRRINLLRDPKGNIRALDASEMGLGKTYQTFLTALRNEGMRPIVVVCPKSLRYQWQHEAILALGERAEILSGRKRRTGSIKLVAPIVIVNYDILREWIPFIKRLKPQLLVADEGHYLLSRKTRRSRAVKALSLTIPNMIVLTGTPITKKPADLWMILNCLRPDVWPNFIDYAWNHCKPQRNPFGGWRYDGADNLPKLNRQLLRHIMVRVLKKDVIAELPAKRRIVVPVDLSSRSEYDRAVNDFLGWLREEAPGKLTSASRASGLVKVGYLKRLIARLKSPAVDEWIDNFLAGSEGKLIVFAVHRKVIARIKERYGETCVVVDGSVSGEKRNLAVRKFQTDPRCRLFVGNIQAAGVGLNLTAADTVLFVELGWKPGEHTQAEDRCFARIGDMHGADVYYIVGRGTIEIPILKMLQKRSKILSAVLDGNQYAKDFDVFDKLMRMLRKQDVMTKREAA